MSDKKTKCPASGNLLPDDVKADYLADPTCSHFHCAVCGRLLPLPKSPYGLVPAHMAGEDDDSNGNGSSTPPAGPTVH